MMKYHGTCVYLCIIYVFYRYILCHWERFLSSRMSISIALSRFFARLLPTHLFLLSSKFVELFFFLVFLFAFNSIIYKRFFFLPLTLCMPCSHCSRSIIFYSSWFCVNPSNHHCFKITMKEIGSFLFHFYFKSGDLENDNFSLLSHASCLFIPMSSLLGQ